MRCSYDQVWLLAVDLREQCLRCVTRRHSNIGGHTSRMQVGAHFFQVHPGLRFLCVLLLRVGVARTLSGAHQQQRCLGRGRQFRRIRDGTLGKWRAVKWYKNAAQMGRHSTSLNPNQLLKPESTPRHRSRGWAALGSLLRPVPSVHQKGLCWFGPWSDATLLDPLHTKIRFP